MGKSFTRYSRIDHLPLRLLLLGFVAILKARNAVTRIEIRARARLSERKWYGINYRKAYGRKCFYGERVIMNEASREAPNINA